MARKTKAVESPLAERIATARRAGRTRQALELARQLYKYEPTDAHLELVRQATLERGQQLQANGMHKDAATIFTNLLTMGGSPEFRASVVERLASAGAVGAALANVEQVADPEVRKRILGQAVDAALAQVPLGKNHLPADLHPQFDAITQAFTHSEAGRDDEARAALQAIDLQSPFLEWKVFLRGLLAYYAKEDDRARENWLRLDPRRMPYRLAAPLRVAVDPGFLNSQTHDTQNKLRAKSLVQQGFVFAPALQELRTLLVDDDLNPAFRRAEQAVQMLRQQHPDLAARLGHCFFWAIVDHGDPDDLNRYLRVFGPPADDPHAYRLEAIALEYRGLMPDAHKCWQYFIDHVAKSPSAWPGESATRVQAMIWSHMAGNAGLARKKPRRSKIPFFGLMDDDDHEPLKPDAETCLRNAIKLAPDRLDSYVALFVRYRLEGETAKARKFGQELLARFPDHSMTLEAMGELCLANQDYKKAQEYFEQALHANPLDRSLRGRLARARRKWALELTLAGKYDKAREQFDQALKLSDGSKTALLCQWAIAAIKAKEPARADELIAQAGAEADQRLACRYALVSESVRAKLSAKEKKRFADELKAALAVAATPAEIQVLLDSAAQQRSMHAESFHGQKTQEKTILKFLEQMSFAPFSETQFERLCAGLQALQARKPWLACVQFARKRFLKNPAFRLSWVDYYLSDRRPEEKVHLAGEHLDAARALIEALPRGEQQQQLLDQLQEKEKIINDLRAGQVGMFDVLDRIFGGGGAGFGFGPDDFDNDDDDKF